MRGLNCVDLIALLSRDSIDAMSKVDMIGTVYFLDMRKSLLRHPLCCWVGVQLDWLVDCKYRDFVGLSVLVSSESDFHVVVNGSVDSALEKVPSL